MEYFIYVSACFLTYYQRVKAAFRNDFHKWRFSIFICFLLLYPVSVTAMQQEPVSGIDCACSSTGNYVAQHRGAVPEVELVTVEEGLSPNEVYRIHAASGVINIYENEPGGELILKIEGIPESAGWGFSPDDHRFVFHYLTAGQQTVELYDLRQRPGVLVGDISRTLLTGESSRIRFSPKGNYLFYLAVTADGQNSVSVVDTSGTAVHETSFAHDQGVGLEGDTFHNSTWGFSRDDHDRTFVYAWTTGDNSIRIRVVNLQDQETVSDLSFPEVYSSFWRFSRCGDTMGLYVQEAGVVSPQNPNPVRIQLHRTRDGHILYNESFSSIDFTVFSNDASDHTVTIGLTPYTLAANTAAQTCPVEPDPVAELENLSISPVTLTGGDKTEGMVTLTEPAPDGGFTIALSSNRSAASVPAQITIPAGQASAVFEITTTPVSDVVTATITASAQGTVRNVNIFIHPPQLKAVRLQPDSVFSGKSSVLYLELEGDAPPDGITISLEHDGTDELELPSETTIWSGNTGNVWFNTRGIAEPMQITIQATLGETMTTTLYLMPAELDDIRYDFEVFSPCVLRWSDNQAIGGRVIGYRVSLNGEAPPDGAVITLLSSDPSVVTPPPTVTIAGRESSALFQVMTAPVTTTRSAPFEASYRQRTLERALTLIAPPVQYYLQELKYPGSRQSSPIRLNNVGQALIISLYDQDFARYHLWENGTWTEIQLPAPEGMRVGIFDFNDMGQYVGAVQEVIERREVAVWKDGVRHPLRIPYGVDPATLHVAAINNRGQVAGNYVNNDNHRAVVRWTHGQPEELTRAEDFLSQHYIFITKDINIRGRVAASGWRYSSTFQLSPFVAAVFEQHNLWYAPRALGSWPDGTHINNHNTWTGGNTQIFRMDNDSYTEVTPPLQTFQQYPHAINDQEEIVGYAQFDFEMEGFSLWQAIRTTAEGTWPLECLIADAEEGFELQYAVDINNAGQILAESFKEDDNNKREYFTWLLTPTDAPHANLRVGKSADAETAETGSEIVYTITIANEGPDEAATVRLSEVIPSNQQVLAADPSQGSCQSTDGILLCEFGTLASGASASLTVTTKAMVTGTSVNRTVATSSTLELDPESNLASVTVTVTAGPPAQASANLGAGETGKVDLSEAGMIIDVTEGSQSAGSVNVTMYHEEPENSQNLPVVSIQAFGGPTEPDSLLVDRYWSIEPVDLEGLTYTLCLNISGLSGVNPDFLVITKRSDSSQPWAVHNSTLRTVDNVLYLCSEGLTEFSQLGIATEKGTWSPPDDPTLLPQPVALVAPEDGEMVDPAVVTFTWQPSEPEVQYYAFELSSNSDFSSIILDTIVTGTMIEIGDLTDFGMYWWRVRAGNASGWGPHSAARHFEVIMVGSELVSGVPVQFELHQNYPNPFNPVTLIRFAIPETSGVRLEVFNILGQKVAQLVDREKEPGWYEAVFDAGSLSSGMYIYRITAGTFSQTRKMTILK